MGEGSAIETLPLWCFKVTHTPIWGPGRDFGPFADIVGPVLAPFPVNVGRHQDGLDIFEGIKGCYKRTHGATSRIDGAAAPHAVPDPV